MSEWKITYDRFRPAQEGLRETLGTLGNGYFATRGACPESSISRIHYPGTYIAGVYNGLKTRIKGRSVPNEDLVNCPNWLLLTFKIDDGEWFTPLKNNILAYSQEINMRSGILSRTLLVRDRSGRRTSIKTRRLVHMEDPHVMALVYSITPVNYDAVITVRSGIDGGVENLGVERYKALNSKHLKGSGSRFFDKNGIGLSVVTSQSKIKVSVASKLRVYKSNTPIKGKIKAYAKKDNAVFQEQTFSAEKKVQYDIEKICSLYTSLDKGCRYPLSLAVRKVRSLPRYKDIEKSHKKEWKRVWSKFYLDIEGDSFTKTVLRLHAFHLLQTASNNSRYMDTGFPARGLHGEAYRGHIFWDEIFIMHYYDIFDPDTARSLLEYRYNRLGSARKYAASNGYKGAMFPWQSSSNGSEQTQEIHLNPMSGRWYPDHSRNQRHISMAVAYNFWKYWEMTRDKDFLCDKGAELVLSVAQFCASLAKFDKNTGRYHTSGIMGPDEFHEKSPFSKKYGLKDNAYSNVMIVWTLMKALEVIDILPERLKNDISGKIGLTAKDLKRWADITRKMNLIIKDGIISQFDGYFDLKELDWKKYRSKYDNIKRMDRILKAEGKTPDDYKVAKQADVLMLFYLLDFKELRGIFAGLGYSLTKNMLLSNYEYYLNRTSHGSTLSKVVHCFMAIMTRKNELAWEWFNDVLRSDIYDTQGGTTQEGIHAGVMGGSMDLIIRGFAGISMSGGTVVMAPNLPKKINKISMRFRHRGQLIRMDVDKKYVMVHLEEEKKKGREQRFRVFGKDFTVKPGASRKISF